MKLRIGQAVRVDNVEVGILGDVVIDPLDRTVTDLIIEPFAAGRMARVAPVSVVRRDKETFHIDLNVDSLDQLKYASASAYVGLATPVQLADGIVVRGDHVMSKPFWHIDQWTGLRKTSDFHQRLNYSFAKAECEIQRASSVACRNGATFGHVEGFLGNSTRLFDVIVRTDGVAKGRFVFVPLSMVSRIRPDETRLFLRSENIGRLPTVDELGPLMAEDPDYVAEILPFRPRLKIVPGAGSKTPNTPPVPNHLEILR